MKTIIHWAQGVRSPRLSFRMFDYGVWCLDWRLRTQVWGLSCSPHAYASYQHFGSC